MTPRAAEGAPPSSWVAAALAADAVAIYMGAGEGASIAAALIAAGKPPDTPVVVVESASLPQHTRRAGRLAELAALVPGRGEAPALILMGAVYAAQAARAPLFEKLSHRA